MRRSTRFLIRRLALLTLHSLTVERRWVASAHPEHEHALGLDEALHDGKVLGVALEDRRTSVNDLHGCHPTDDEPARFGQQRGLLEPDLRLGRGRAISDAGLDGRRAGWLGHLT